MNYRMNKLKCQCDCEFQSNWPFITSYCVHGKRLIKDTDTVKTIITGYNIPDSVMNIIRASGTKRGIK